MRIQCLNQNYDSVEIPMGGTLIKNLPDPVQVRAGKQRVYKFIRTKDGELVADITHQADIVRLLQIREGFTPHGDEAREDAINNYGWSEEAPEPAGRQLGEGQPDVIDEMLEFDDDGNVVSAVAPPPDEDDDDLMPAVDENGVPLVSEPEATVVISDGLPDVPVENADGAVWMQYAASLPGISNPNDKPQLEAYALNNYGVNLDLRQGVLKLIKAIGELQAKNA